MNVSYIELTVQSDERGSLVAIEECEDVPFRIRRVYYLFRTQPGLQRGCHAHYRTRQVAICLNGSCKAFLDDGKRRAEVTLDRPDQGLVIEPMVWHKVFEFSPNCMLLILANTPYDESDYIRSYAAFLEELS
ncbi:MAG: FdtA/QdtA family cupin domain-containing protein [Gemmatimonadota bacterium]